MAEARCRKDILDLLFAEIDNCRRCADILGEEGILPRFGFPPGYGYVAMVVGAEPGLRALDHGRMTPQSYIRAFSPLTRNTNTAKMFFRDLYEAGLPWDRFFFTNAVKCPAPKHLAPRCYQRCGVHLVRQLEAVQPEIVVMWGSAPAYAGMPVPSRGEILDGRFQEVPMIAINHPQGATRVYRAAVVAKVRRMLPGVV